MAVMIWGLSDPVTIWSEVVIAVTVLFRLTSVHFYLHASVVMSVMTGSAGLVICWPALTRAPKAEE